MFTNKFVVLAQSLGVFISGLNKFHIPLKKSEICLTWNSAFIYRIEV
jgi:hypothetical protein